MNKLERAAYQLGKAVSMHGDRYTYDDWMSTFIGAKSKVTVGCRVHGDFHPVVQNHTMGSGCLVCANEVRDQAKVLPWSEVMRRSAIKHGDRYRYNRASYAGTHKKMSVKCGKHGWFSQLAGNHVAGHGCPMCAGKGTVEFRLSEFLAKSPVEYAYPDIETTFVDALTKIVAVCKDHGEFRMRPSDLLNDHKCPSCATTRSRGEVEVEDFVKSLGVNVKSSVRDLLGGRGEIDIYCPDQKVAIEYCGAYMHSVQKGKGRSYHKAKFDKCRDQGIHLLTIWDYDWRDNKAVVQSIITHKLGKSAVRVGARQCAVVDVSESDRKLFLNKWHLQGAPHLRDRTVGLEWKGELVAVMSFARVRFTTDGVELTRFASKGGVVVAGGFTRLLNAGLQGDSCISFVDHCVASGGAYTGAGFEVVGTVAPAYRWTKGVTVLTRFKTMRKHLGKLLGDGYDESVSERDNMVANGWSQFYDCGKTKLMLVRDKGHRP